MPDRHFAPLGMPERDLYTYLDEVLRSEAAQAADVDGNTITEQLESRGFQAAAAAGTYAIRLIQANNVILTRQLLDLGLITPDNLPDDDPGELDANSI